MPGTRVHPKVYVRGCGIVCALGSTQQQLAQACQDNRVAPVLRPCAPAGHALVPFYPISTPPPATQSNRLYDLLNHAVAQAMDDAALNGEALARTAVFCGSTACDISDLEHRYAQDLARNPGAMALYRSGFGILAGYVRDRFELGGEEYSFNTACSSSANALITAAQMIAAGRYEHAIVLGVEVANELSLQGFNSMMLLSQDAIRPFDAHRNGTILGEAVSAVILSRTPPGRSRFGTEKPFYFLGGANLGDIKSVTSSHADVIAEVIQQALDNAGLDKTDVDFIKAHGTGTDNNDSAEGLAMRLAFGDTPPPFTSLKPFLGHTLGACGITELVLLLATIGHGFIPATPGFQTADPRINLQPMRRQQPFQEGVIMLNFFGFGGNNSSLLMGNKT